MPLYILTDLNIIVFFVYIDFRLVVTDYETKLLSFRIEDAEVLFEDAEVIITLIEDAEVFD